MDGFNWAHVIQSNSSSLHRLAKPVILSSLCINIFPLTGTKGGYYIQCTKLLLSLWKHGLDSWGRWLQEPHIHSGLCLNYVQKSSFELLFWRKKINVVWIMKQFEPAPRRGEPDVTRRTPDYFLWRQHNSSRSCKVWLLVFEDLCLFHLVHRILCSRLLLFKINLALSLGIV